MVMIAVMAIVVTVMPPAAIAVVVRPVIADPPA